VHDPAETRRADQRAAVPCAATEVAADDGKSSWRYEKLRLTGRLELALFARDRLCFAKTGAGLLPVSNATSRELIAR
jgi:hypothetical protein